ncbi:MAG: 2Fe-2S iron-sulfur cluster binding domain-containing protein [Rhodoferax sp.]|jgi:ferredoxin|nr:2Fe-2S iron-sulfur cluster binding domain-containing protein [Rhodoferax sp.]
MTAPATAPFFIGKILPDGQQFDAWPNQPLLVSLEASGIDWPSSCRQGDCHTCLGQLESGEVRYPADCAGFGAIEKALGDVLPCVAHPCSDLVLHRSW